MSAGCLDPRKELIDWGAENINCPQCRLSLKGKKTAVGSGKHEDGRFCSLDCFADFHFKNPNNQEK